MAPFQTSPHVVYAADERFAPREAVVSAWVTPRPETCIWCGDAGAFRAEPQVVVEVDCVLERWRCGMCRGEVTTPIPRSAYTRAVVGNARWPERGCA